MDIRENRMSQRERRKKTKKKNLHAAQCGGPPLLLTRVALTRSLTDVSTTHQTPHSLKEANMRLYGLREESQRNRMSLVSEQLGQAVES